MAFDRSLMHTGYTRGNKTPAVSVPAAPPSALASAYIPTIAASPPPLFPAAVGLFCEQCYVYHFIHGVCLHGRGDRCILHICVTSNHKRASHLSNDESLSVPLSSLWLR